jgi:hypothetical protein
MHILSDRHSSSFFIHFKLIIALLSRNSVTSSLQDFPFHLYPTPANSSGHFVTKTTLTFRVLPFAVGEFPSICDFRQFDRRGVYVGVGSSTSRFKILLMAKILGDTLVWIKKKPPRSTFKRLFLETKMLLILIMSGSAKSPTEGLKDSE